MLISETPLMRPLLQKSYDTSGVATCLNLRRHFALISTTDLTIFVQLPNSVRLISGILNYSETLLADLAISENTETERSNATNSAVVTNAWK